MPLQGLQDARMAEGLLVPIHFQPGTTAPLSYVLYPLGLPHFALTFLFLLSACLLEISQSLLCPCPSPHFTSPGIQGPRFLPSPYPGCSLTCSVLPLSPPSLSSLSLFPLSPPSLPLSPSSPLSPSLPFLPYQVSLSPGHWLGWAGATAFPPSTFPQPLNRRLWPVPIRFLVWLFQGLVQEQLSNSMVELRLGASLSSQGLGQAALSNAIGGVPSQCHDVPFLLSPELDSQTSSLDVWPSI